VSNKRESKIKEGKLEIINSKELSMDIYYMYDNYSQYVKATEMLLVEFNKKDSQVFQSERVYNPIVYLFRHTLELGAKLITFTLFDKKAKYDHDRIDENFWLLSDDEVKKIYKNFTKEDDVSHSISFTDSQYDLIKKISTVNNISRERVKFDVNEFMLLLNAYDDKKDRKNTKYRYGENRDFDNKIINRISTDFRVLLGLKFYYDVVILDWLERMSQSGAKPSGN
jgi:hypothetical protein